MGIIILERCQVEPDNESGNRNSFKLGTYLLLHLFVYYFTLSTARAVFQENDSGGYLFTANSARDQDEWTTALNSSRYRIDPLKVILHHPAAVFLVHSGATV